MTNKAKMGAIGIVAVSIAAAGCGGGTNTEAAQASGSGQTPAPAATASTVTGSAPAYKFRVKTGAPIPESSINPKLIATEVAQRSFKSRPDPFALLPSEQSFDKSQLAERLTQEMGYSTVYEPPEEKPEFEQVEPQPYRRLAGVLVGDTVSAILIMEDGTPVLIKPGMRIPNSPWRVVSIDEEKAVLRRAGNLKPTQIIVRLESPPGGVPNQNQGGGARPGGGGPTGPPGGFGPPPGAVPGGGGRPGGGKGGTGGIG